MATKPASKQPAGHQYAPVNAGGNAKLILGDVHNYGVLFGASSEETEAKEFGLCLGSAPVIPPNNFIGRMTELEQMTACLQPNEKTVTEQKRLSIGGMGGVGKTQLSLAYVRANQHIYTSVFWLNAATEASLTASFRSMASLFIKVSDLDGLGDQQIVARSREWLSNIRHKHWLLVFDNYDDPELFEIEKYFPLAGHGSIIITTRRPDLVNAEALRIQPLIDIDECLQILQVRSRRQHVQQDRHARLLAERLSGLPLALVTAGAHLSKSTLTFEQYLQHYNQTWNLDPRRPLRLVEYQDRTLHTTWNFSYSRLEADDPDAAKVLQLLAYFDNQDISFSLLHAGLNNRLPDWLQSTLKDQLAFESVMRTLVEYCFIEVNATSQSYSVHTCVHDWMLGELNKILQPQMYWYAVGCVSASIDKIHGHMLDISANSNSARHALRLMAPRFNKDPMLENIPLDYWVPSLDIASLLLNKTASPACERLLLQVQLCLSRANPSTDVESAQKEFLSLTVSTSLGMLYHRQSRLDEAEKMLLQARHIMERQPPRENYLCDNIYPSLGYLYRIQDRLSESEQMYLKGLAYQEGIPGSMSQNQTFSILTDLAAVYTDQERYEEAQELYERAIDGLGKLLGPEHPSSMKPCNGLGVVWIHQGKLEEAEQIFLRIVSVAQRNLGSRDRYTLNAMSNLSTVYYRQNRLGLAKTLGEQVLAGYEEVVGPNNLETLSVMNSLAYTYFYYGNLEGAEQLWQQALVEFRKILPPNHASILATIASLGLLYHKQGKLQDAESYFLQALVGREHTLGFDHIGTQKTREYLGNLYDQQGRVEDAIKIRQPSTRLSN